MAVANPQYETITDSSDDDLPIVTLKFAGIRPGRKAANLKCKKEGSAKEAQD
jgi:hypothetical protein